MLVPIQKLIHATDLPLPAYATFGSAGLDLYAAVDEPIILSPYASSLVATGISISLPIGYEAQVRPRSGFALKHSITVLNSPGTIDSDYRGEIKALLINLGKEEFIIERKMRIAQMVISKYERVKWQEVKDLGSTNRDSGGFGSTGF